MPPDLFPTDGNRSTSDTCSNHTGPMGNTPRKSPPNKGTNLFHTLGNTREHPNLPTCSIVPLPLGGTGTGPVGQEDRKDQKLTTPTITVWESGPNKPEVHAVWNPLLGSYDIAIILDGGYGSEDDACKMANFWLRDLQEEGIPVADAIGPAAAAPQDYRPTVFAKQFAKHELQWLMEQYLAKAQTAHQSARTWMNRCLEAESRLAIYEPGDESIC